MVVSIQDLECLDALVWLGKGDVAAEKFNLSQSSISRAAQRAALALCLELFKVEGEWFVRGDEAFINLERLIHQKIRLDQDYPLRFDTQFTYSGAFSPFIRDKHILGTSNFLEINKPIQLIRLGIIDAWIGGYPDLPSDDDPELLCIHLTRQPLRLVVNEKHPLAALGEAVTLKDVVQFPSIALKDGALPETQRHLRSLGLWNAQVKGRRFTQEGVMGLTDDQLTVGYATDFTIRFYEGPMVFLPINLNHCVGQTLVVRREYANHPRIQGLLASLKQGCISFANQYPDVSLCFQADEA